MDSRGFRFLILDFRFGWGSDFESGADFGFWIWDFGLGDLGECRMSNVECRIWELEELDSGSDLDLGLSKGRRWETGRV